MSILLADRVQETTTTSGTGSLTLLGAVTGYQSFNQAFANGSTVYYTIDDTVGNWEVGYGTVSTGNLSRDYVLSSSNSNALVNFGVGTKRVFCSIPAKSFRQEGANAVNRQAQSKMQERISVADYGVLGDGTDETDKIQAALNAAAGNELWFEPNKTYIAYTLNVAAGTTINLNGATIQKLPYDSAGMQASQVAVRSAAVKAWVSTTRYYIGAIATLGGVWYRAIRPEGSVVENINHSPNTHPEWWTPFTPASTVDAQVFWSTGTILAAPLLYIRGDNVTIKNGTLDGNRANETYNTGRWGGSLATEINRSLIVASSSEVVVWSNNTLGGIYNLTIQDINFNNAYGDSIVTEWIRGVLLIENCVETNAGNIFYFVVGRVSYVAPYGTYVGFWGTGTTIINNCSLSGPRGNGNVLNPGVSAIVGSFIFTNNIVDGTLALTSGGVKSGAQTAVYANNIFINEYIKPQEGAGYFTEALTITNNNFSTDNPYTHVTGVAMGNHACAAITVSNNSITNGVIGVDFSSYNITLANNSVFCNVAMKNPQYGIAATWSSSTTYNIGDVVAYSGQYYYSLINSNLNIVPTSSIYISWVPLANEYSSIGGGASAGAYWSSSTTYTYNYIVQYLGIWYICTAAYGVLVVGQQPDISPSVWAVIPPMIPAFSVTGNVLNLGGYANNNCIGFGFVLNTTSVCGNVFKAFDTFVSTGAPQIYCNDTATCEIRDNQFSSFRKLGDYYPIDYTVPGTSTTYSMKRFSFVNNTMFDMNVFGADVNASGGLTMNYQGGRCRELIFTNNTAVFGDTGTYNQYQLSLLMQSTSMDLLVIRDNVYKGTTSNANAYVYQITGTAGTSAIGDVIIKGNYFSRPLYLNNFTATASVVYDNYFPGAAATFYGNVFPTASRKGTAVITGVFGTTVGSAGGATALPATPAGYVQIMLDQTAYKLPYYNS